ncbi:MAG: hypothetical protein KGH69_04480 [Candidatus Micrarchaeota archaeon]|nr:hypothetical protein [Candidatus Micrarchaeota archaeon]
MNAISFPGKRQRLANQIFKELQRTRSGEKRGLFRSIVRARNNRAKEDRAF